MDAAGSPATSVTEADLAELFDRFHVSAFRLETLQTYDVSGEAVAFRAFREGLPRPERSVRTEPYLAAVARAALAGKLWDRVRIVEFPLSEYTRYALRAYPENQAAGEQVHLVSRSLADERYGQLRDFWLFDGGHDDACAVYLNYDADGTFTGLEAVNDRDTVLNLEIAALNLLRVATPLAEFLNRPVGV